MTERAKIIEDIKYEYNRIDNNELDYACRYDIDSLVDDKSDDLISNIKYNVQENICSLTNEILRLENMKNNLFQIDSLLDTLQTITKEEAEESRPDQNIPNPNQDGLF